MAFCSRITGSGSAGELLRSPPAGISSLASERCYSSPQLSCWRCGASDTEDWTWKCDKRSFCSFFSVVFLKQKIKVGSGGGDGELPSGFFWPGSRQEPAAHGVESLGIGQPSCSLGPAASQCRQHRQRRQQGPGQRTRAAQRAGGNLLCTL